MGSGVVHASDEDLRKEIPFEVLAIRTFARNRVQIRASGFQ